MSEPETMPGTLSGRATRQKDGAGWRPGSAARTTAGSMFCIAL